MSEIMSRIEEAAARRAELLAVVPLADQPEVYCEAIGIQNTTPGMRFTDSLERAVQRYRARKAVSPTHVVADTRDGFVFSRDSQGRPFTEASARQFADERNDGYRPGFRPYEVYQLTVVPA